MTKLSDFIKAIQELNQQEETHVSVTFHGSWGHVNYRSPQTGFDRCEKEFDNQKELLDFLESLRRDKIR